MPRPRRVSVTHQVPVPVPAAEGAPPVHRRPPVESNFIKYSARGARRPRAPPGHVSTLSASWPSPATPPPPSPVPTHPGPRLPSPSALGDAPQPPQAAASFSGKPPPLVTGRADFGTAAARRSFPSHCSHSAIALPASPTTQPSPMQNPQAPDTSTRRQADVPVFEVRRDRCRRNGGDRGFGTGQADWPYGAAQRRRAGRYMVHGRPLPGPYPTWGRVGPVGGGVWRALRTRSMRISRRPGAAARTAADERWRPRARHTTDRSPPPLRPPPR